MTSDTRPSMSTPPGPGAKFKELEIEISPDLVPGQYRVKATSFDQAVYRGTIELPVPVIDVQQFLRSMAKAVLPPAWLGQTVARDMVPESITSEMWRETPREFGVRLYNALFRDQILRALVEANARKPEDSGLRIRLSFDMSREDMPQVLGLPWELLAESVDESPITVLPQYTLVRHLEVSKPAKESAVFEGEVVVLVLMASPRGHGTLDLKAEEAELRKAFNHVQNVRVVFQRATQARLLRSLKDEDPHVIHFMGHGDFRAGRGVLLFETEPDREDGQGDPDPVDAETLAIELTGEHRLRLVFLNACRTAVTGLTSTTDPFAGVATSLVRGGVTAVLAMQFPITDGAAIAFSTVFYQELVEGEPVDAAVRAARTRIHSREHAEWATPVLFMRSKSGELFQRSDVRDGFESIAAQASIRVIEPLVTVENPLTVFLATTSDRMRAWERRALKELPARGFTVLVADPTPQAEHESAIRACAGSVDLFVHLLGDLPGEMVEGATDGRSYAMEQYRIGHQCARAQLVFLPTGLTPAAVADPAYRAFLQDIESQPRRAARLEVITTDVDALVRDIERKRDDLLRAPVGTYGVYLDVHQKDEPAMAVLTQLLESWGVRPLTPARDQSPRDTMDVYKAAIGNVPLVLVVAGSVDDDWVKKRVIAAIHAGIERDPSIKVAVVRLPGRAPLPPMPMDRPVFGDGSTLEETRLKALLPTVVTGAA